jgi:hypothetical protein
MTGKLAFVFAIACTACTGPYPAAAGEQVLPAEVAAFVERRDQCDHFRGEESYDQQRAAELRSWLAQTCKGTDAELARLRARYAGDHGVSEKLSAYEAKVE